MPEYRAAQPPRSLATLGMTGARLPPPQPFRPRPQQSRGEELLVDAADALCRAARERPGQRRVVDGAVDVGHGSLGESPSALLERLELHRLGEGAHGSLAVL